MESRTIRRPAPRGAFACIALVAAIAAGVAVANAAEAVQGFQYVSPMPSSENVSRWNNVAIRPGEILDPASLDASRILVAGSMSGTHRGELRLADDRRTFLFEPAQPYAPGETVAVTLAPGVRTAAGVALAPLTFHFSVSRADPSAAALRSCDEIEPLPPAFAGAPSPTASSRGTVPARTAGLPPGYPPVALVSSNDPDPGYVFISPRTNESGAPLLILDNHMMPIFYRRAANELLDFKMQKNGLLTYFDKAARKWYALDSTYTIVDSFAAGNGYLADFHDMQLLPNGHALLVIYDTQPVRMDRIVPGGDPDANVSGIVLQEIDTAKHVVFQWRSWDHFEITDSVDQDLTASYIDYMHCNAIEPDTDGNLLISSRHLNEITKINRQTGEVMWRFGLHARNNQFLIRDDARGTAYQHDIRRLPNGHITLFDNGNFMDPQTSRAVEYELDEPRKLAWLKWEVWPAVPGWGNSNGSVQRRPDGGTMIGWGAGTVSPNVTDLHADGTTAMEIQVTATTYRAFRYPWEGRRFTTATRKLDFGGVRVGERDTIALQITNRIATPVTITSFVTLDSAEFRVSEPAPLTLPSHGVVTVHVVCEPAGLGPSASTLYLRSDTSTEIIAQDVQLECQGVTGALAATLLSPNGGETCVAGETELVTWYAAQGIGVTSVDLLLSRDGPEGTYEPIALAVPDTGAYLWHVEGVGTSDAYLRVVAHDSHGSTATDRSDAPFTIAVPVAGVGDAPGRLALSPARPNPTSGGTSLDYTVTRPGTIRLRVFDVNGRVMAVLAEGMRDAGTYHAGWDGVHGGRRAAPGVYVVRFEVAGRSTTRRIVVIR